MWISMEDFVTLEPHTKKTQIFLFTVLGAGNFFSSIWLQN